MNSIAIVWAFLKPPPVPDAVSRNTDSLSGIWKSRRRQQRDAGSKDLEDHGATPAAAFRGFLRPPLTFAQGKKCALCHPIQRGTLLERIIIAIYRFRLCTHLPGMFF